MLAGCLLGRFGLAHVGLALAPPATCLVPALVLLAPRLSDGPATSIASRLLVAALLGLW